MHIKKIMSHRESIVDSLDSTCTPKSLRNATCIKITPIIIVANMRRIITENNVREIIPSSYKDAESAKRNDARGSNAPEIKSASYLVNLKIGTRINTERNFENTPTTMSETANSR